MKLKNVSPQDRCTTVERTNVRGSHLCCYWRQLLVQHVNFQQYILTILYLLLSCNTIEHRRYTDELSVAALHVNSDLSLFHPITPPAIPPIISSHFAVLLLSPAAALSLINRAPFPSLSITIPMCFFSFSTFSGISNCWDITAESLTFLARAVFSKYVKDASTTSSQPWSVASAKSGHK